MKRIHFRGVFTPLPRRNDQVRSLQVSRKGVMQTPPSGNAWKTLNPQEQAQLGFNVQANSGIDVGDEQYGYGATPVLPDYILPAGAKEGDPGTSPDLYYVNPEDTSFDDFNAFNQIVRANKSGTIYEP